MSLVSKKDMAGEDFMALLFMDLPTPSHGVIKMASEPHFDKADAESVVTPENLEDLIKALQDAIADYPSGQ